MMQNTRAAEGLTGRHVLLLVVTFFGVVFAVNVYFIATALSTHSGVVANEPYRKGLRYNERIAADDRQAALGWTEDVALSADGRRLVVTLRQASNEPVSGFKVMAEIGRPATTRDSAVLELSEIGPGRYEVAIPQREGGAYVVSIEVIDRSQEMDSVVHRAKRRLWLQR